MVAFEFVRVSIMDKERIYIAIDLKSFYASVECVARGLDPLHTHLVVADRSRTEKTICLAVTPSLKALGIPGRPRLFEVVERVKKLNLQRQKQVGGTKFAGWSILPDELERRPDLAIGYAVARPRMSLYMQVSAQIYRIYTRFIAPQDIHVYSVDEVFIDATAYLRTYHCTAEELAVRLVRAVLAETGITATAGIGTNLYLAKIAMDIVAKRCEPDANGVRLAKLDEMSYRRLLWTYRPLTDFWRVGRGYANRLASLRVFTMGDVALLSVTDEERLYKMFGVNAELLIDHAWGWEACTMADIKNYRSRENSISSGQVLQSPYNWENGRLVVREMAESLALDLLRKDLVTDQVGLDVGYDAENLLSERGRSIYAGPVVTDHYGRLLPKPAHGVYSFAEYTDSADELVQGLLDIYDRTVDRRFTVRRLTVTACRVLSDADVGLNDGQQSLFDLTDKERERKKRRERARQLAILQIKRKYGKNAILKVMDLQEGATARERNLQVGGHRS